MTTDPTTFDDPALRAAVKRAWGDETAPPELRADVEQLLQAERAAAASALAPPDVIRVAPAAWRRRAAWRLSVAAVVVLGVGLVAFQGGRPGPGAGGQAASAAATLPPELGDQLLRRHEECARIHPHDHHLFADAPKDNNKAIASGMAAQLNHPVVAPTMGLDWDFWGAAVCPVGRTASAHLVYARADALVSVFSLPASFFPSCKDREACDATLEGHPVAGFVEGGAFYCVVATPGSKEPVDMQQVRALRDRLRTEVAAGRFDLGRTRLAALHP